MLLPKKVKYRKWHKMRHNTSKIKIASRGLTIAFGSHGLKAMTAGRIKSKQIEAARKAIMHEVSKTGKVWIRIFPDKPFTQKPAEIPMGSGKGDPQGYEFQAWPGRMLFEIDGVTEAVAKEALRKGGAKLPVKTKIIARESH